MSDEALPVDLVLVFLAWVVFGHLEDLDQLAHGEPCPLVRRGHIVNLQQAVRVRGQQSALLNAVSEPVN